MIFLAPSQLESADQIVLSGGTRLLVPTSGGSGPTQPDSPTGLLTMSSGYKAVTLDWDNQGGVTFSVFRNGSLVASGLTESTYIDNPPAAGTTYSYTLTATDNMTSLESAPCSPVDGTSGAGSTPSNDIAPSISQGFNGLLSLDTTGSWSGDPNSFTFTRQWQFSPSASWSDIAGEIGDTYLMQQGPGHYRCVVTATNAVGSTSVASNEIFYDP